MIAPTTTHTTKILLVQLRQLGDILLTTPLIPALTETFQEIASRRPTCEAETTGMGRLEISFLTHSMGNVILSDFPGLARVFTYSEKDTLVAQARLIQNLRQESFDYVVDCMNNPRSALLTFLSGGKVRLGFRSARRWAYHQRLEKSGSQVYIVKEKLRFAEALMERIWGERFSEPFPPCVARSKIPLPLVPFGPEDSAKALNFFKKQSSQNRLRFILSPTHRHSVRLWPLERFARMADWLVTEATKMARDAGLEGAEVYWLWGPGEEPVVDRCLSLCSQPTTKLPPTSFREMAAFIANAHMFLGNSNGPSHVAVSVATPSLQLHGPTDGRSWCPPVPEHRYVQGTSIQAIAPETVQEAITALFPHILVSFHTHGRLKGIDRSVQHFAPVEW